MTGASLSTSATSASNVGTYGIALGAASAGNYTITEVGGTLTVTPASLTITANDAGKLYGAANPALSATYTGLVNGDSSSVVTGASLSTSATSASNVGTYGIALGAASAGNYTITEVGGTLTVTPASLTITANDAGKIYGAANPALSATYTGDLVNGDIALHGGDLTGRQPQHERDLGTRRCRRRNVGTYGIALGIALGAASAGNYTITEVGGNLTVTPASLTITANDAGKIYGAANPALSATYTGLVNGDASTVVTGASLSTTATTASNVGTYGIALGAASAGNYTITEVGGNLTVTPASLTITANDAGKIYGAANPALSATYTGLVNGDTSAVVTGASLSTSATSASNVGTYGIALGAASAGNYTITEVGGNLTVTPASLTITANDAGKLYGAANPALSATYTGLVNGDSSSVVTGASLSTSATSASNVGTYGIALGTATAGNYTITEVGGNLTVTPASLTITANDASKIYGAANPALSATYTGLVNGDASTVVTGASLSAPARPRPATSARTASRSARRVPATTRSRKSAAR